MKVADINRRRMMRFLQRQDGNGILLIFFGILLQPVIASNNQNSTDIASDSSPLAPNTSPIAWVIGIFILPLITMLWQIYRSHYSQSNPYQSFREDAERFGATSASRGDIASSSTDIPTKTPIDLSAVKVTSQEAENIVKEIIATDQAMQSTSELQKRLKILYTMALVWTKEARSFYQLEKDEETHLLITTKTAEFMRDQIAHHNDFIIYNNQEEGIELYSIVSKAIKDQQHKVPSQIRYMANVSSALYICGCMFSVFASIYVNTWDFITKKPWLIVPMIELMVVSSGIANHLFCTKRSQILLTKILEFSAIKKPRSENHSQLMHYGTKTLDITAIVIASGFGILASTINASLPFMYKDSIPISLNRIYGGINQEDATSLSTFLGNSFAIGTITPISILYGYDAYCAEYDIGRSLFRACQNGIRKTFSQIKNDFANNKNLYFSHLAFIGAGIIRTVKFYTIITKRDRAIFEANEWPPEIVDNIAPLVIAATIPLTIKSMVATSRRIYTTIATLDEMEQYSIKEKLMLGIVILNAVANSFLAMSGFQNLEGFDKKLWEIISDLATGVVSFGVCTRFIREPLDMPTIDEIKSLVKYAERETKAPQQLMTTMSNRLESTTHKTSPWLKPTAATEVFNNFHREKI